MSRAEIRDLVWTKTMIRAAADSWNIGVRPPAALQAFADPASHPRALQPQRSQEAAAQAGAAAVE